MSTDKKTIEWYNKNAEGYAKHVRDPRESKYHAYYEKPAMYALLPDLTEKSVISLGCGTGEDSHYLKDQGALRSVGIDISEGQIEIASKSYNTCDFQVMDMENLGFPDESFDFAYSSLALSYLKDWTKVLPEVYRVLKPGAQFLFSCEHPINTAMEFTSESNGLSHRTLSVALDKGNDVSQIVGDYINKHPSPAGISFDVTTWHRSFGEISSDVTASGCRLKQIVEPLPLAQMKEIKSRTYESLLKIPEFIIFQLEKPD